VFIFYSTLLFSVYTSALSHLVGFMQLPSSVEGTRI